MPLQLGYSAIRNREDYALRDLIEEFYNLDIYTLHLLSHMNPVIDENLFRIYAATYKKDIERSSDVEIKRMLTIYTPELQAFVSDNFFFRLKTILKWWKMIIDLQKSFARVPSTVYPTFQNFLRFVKNNPEQNDFELFKQFKSEMDVNIYANHGSSMSCNIRNEDMHGLTYEETIEFFSFVEKKVENCFLPSKNNIVRDDRQKTQSLLESIAILISMFKPIYQNTHPVNNFDEFFKKRIEDQYAYYTSTSLNAYLTNFSGLDLSHVICLYADTNVPKMSLTKSDAFRYTDAYKLLYTWISRDRTEKRLERDVKTYNVSVATEKEA